MKRKSSKEGDSFCDPMDVPGAVVAALTVLLHEGDEREVERILSETNPWMSLGFLLGVTLALLEQTEDPSGTLARIALGAQLGVEGLL